MNNLIARIFQTTVTTRVDILHRAVGVLGAVASVEYQFRRICLDLIAEAALVAYTTAGEGWAVLFQLLA